MQDWQIAVLRSRDLRVDQDQYTGYRLVIRRTDPEHRMRIHEIVAVIRHSSRKPVIMCPERPDRGMFAPRREVLDILMESPEYEDYMVALAEAKMSGAMP